MKTSENSDSASDNEDSSEEETKMADKQLTILVGNETDDSSRYVMVNDSNEVYTMSTDTLSALTDKSEEDFWGYDSKLCIFKQPRKPQSKLSGQ